MKDNTDNDTFDWVEEDDLHLPDLNLEEEEVDWSECSLCGTQNEDDDIFCSECGTRLRESPETEEEGYQYDPE